MSVSISIFSERFKWEGSSMLETGTTSGRLIPIVEGDLSEEQLELGMTYNWRVA